MEEAKDLKSFFVDMPITKDVGSIRKKGILLEDALELLKKRFPMKCIHAHRAGWYEQMVYEGEGFRIAWAYFRLSIPAFVVGVDDIKIWENMKDVMREGGFIR